MNNKLSIGIVGYGNLGKGVETAIKQNPDMQLVAVFTRRPPATTQRLRSGPVTRSRPEKPTTPNGIEPMMTYHASR